MRSNKRKVNDMDAAATRTRAKPTARPAAPSPADPDIVDRAVEILLQHHRMPDYPPDVKAEVLADVKARLRAEFRGESIYVAACPPTARQERAAAVLRLFNGGNSTEVARRLGIGRATVFRILKQAGHARGAALFKVAPADRLTFAGNETPRPIPSDDA